MNIRFSPTTGCFYPLDIDYPSLPPDVIIVPMEAYTAAMSRPAGKEFTIVDGAVVLHDTPPPPYDSVPYLNAIRVAREVALNRITGVAMSTDDADLRAACRVARQNLLDITAAPGVIAAVSGDELRAAVDTVYGHIVESMPAELRNVFVGVNLTTSTT